jgi:hypothetical protein
VVVSLEMKERSFAKTRDSIRVEYYEMEPYHGVLQRHHANTTGKPGTASLFTQTWISTLSMANLTSHRPHTK